VNFDLTPAQRLPLQVAGPACLAATCVIVVLAMIFSRLWHKEMRRQRREMALKARAQLQTLAGDLIAKRGSASGRGERRPTLTAAAALQDPQLRRQLLDKLRQHDLSGSVTVCLVFRLKSSLTLFRVKLFLPKYIRLLCASKACGLVQILINTRNLRT